MRNAPKKILAYLLIGVVAATVLAVVVAEVSARISRRKAEQLLHDVRQLQVGKSTYEEARAASVRHGGVVSPFDHSGCNPTHCTFELPLWHYPFFMDIWGRSLNIEVTYRVLRVFPLLGLQDWEAVATVRVDRGIVTQISYRVFVRGSGGWVLGRDTNEFLAIPEYLQDRMGQRSYLVNWFNITTVGGGEGITCTLTPQANTEERNRAYDFDFDCLTRLGGCTSLCQIAPASFADLVNEARHMPYLDEHDPRCAKFKPPEGNPNNAPNPLGR